MQQIKQILPRHYEILRLSLLGLSPREISKTIDMSTTSLSFIIKSPIFQAELSRRRSHIEGKEDDLIASGVSRARDLLEEASVDAATTQIELLADQDSRVKHSAARDILDRTLGKKGEESRGGTVVLEIEAINLLKVAFREIKREVVDATSV